MFISKALMSKSPPDTSRPASSLSCSCCTRSANASDQFCHVNTAPLSLSFVTLKCLSRSVRRHAIVAPAEGGDQRQNWGLDWARLAWVRRGSAWLESARLSSGRRGVARLGSARLGSAWLGSARLHAAIRTQTAMFYIQQNLIHVYDLIYQ